MNVKIFEDERLLIKWKGELKYDLAHVESRTNTYFFCFPLISINVNIFCIIFSCNIIIQLDTLVLFLHNFVPTCIKINSAI